MKAIKKIVIKKRNDDFHAQLDGHPEIWGCGKTAGAAVYSVMTTHPDKFGVEIAWDDEDRWTRRYLAHDPLTKDA